jgi:hypothetical protein
MRGCARRNAYVEHVTSMVLRLLCTCCGRSQRSRSKAQLEVGQYDTVADGHADAVRVERGGGVEGRGVSWGSPGHTSVDHLSDKRSVGWLHTRRVAHRRDDGRRRRSEVLLDVRDGRLARLQHPTCNTR